MNLRSAAQFGLRWDGTCCAVWTFAMNDRTQPPGTAPMDVVSDPAPRQRMRRLRKHLLPLQSESISPIDLPSVRTGLLTKLNSLTVGLIALTGLAISAYYFWQQWSNEGSELRQRGRTIAAVFAEQSEFGVYTSDRASLEPMLDSLATIATWRT